MMLLDEIRCERIIVADVLGGNPAKAQWLLLASAASGPFYCLSSAVVNRSSLRAGQERNEAELRRIPQHSKRVQGSFRARRCETVGFFPSAPIPGRPLQSAMIALRVGPGGEKESPGCA